MKVMEVRDLVRAYNKNWKVSQDTDLRVLKSISFDVEEGDFLGIMGRSGCGKTTLLKTLGLIDRPSDGSIILTGQSISKMTEDELADARRDKIGFIFQDFYLMDSLTVRENIMIPLILKDEDPCKMKSLVYVYTKKFQIESLLSRHTSELSGGERQRVAICRALINDPDIILADEPTGNLDSKSGNIVINTLSEINKAMNKTIIMVTHDPLMASYCSRVVLLKDGLILKNLVNSGNRAEFYQTVLSNMAEL